MLHSGCDKLHQKFRDFVGLPMGLLREESPKNRMNTGLFGSRSGEVRPQSRSSRTAVQQALICFRCIFTALLRQSRFLLPAFPENWGARLRTKRTPPRLWAGGVLL